MSDARLTPWKCNRPHAGAASRAKDIERVRAEMFTGFASLDDEELPLVAASPAALDVERLGYAMSACDGVNWPKRWEPEDFAWVARQVAAEYARLSRSAGEQD